MELQQVEDALLRRHGSPVRGYKQDQGPHPLDAIPSEEGCFRIDGGLVRVFS